MARAFGTCETTDAAIDEDRKADMFLRSGMGVIDNVFLKTRRLINALERPIGTPTGRNTVWHGYAPYNVAMLEKYVTIFRTVNNFVSAGDDGATPAMRLGFAQQPLGFEDILWPGSGCRGRSARGGAGRGCWWLDGNSHLGTGTVPACRCVASPMQMDGQRVWTSTT